MSSDLLKEFTDHLQTFVDSLKVVSHCSEVASSVLKLQKAVEILSNDAEKQDVSDADFQEYKTQLNKSKDILIELEAPTIELNKTVPLLCSVFKEVITDKQLTNENSQKIKQLLNWSLKEAKHFQEGLLEFKCSMEQVRKFCENAKKNTESEAERLQKAASNKKWTGVGGATLGGLGVGAVTLAILGIATGGVAVAVVAAGSAAAIAGAGVVGDAVLSANALEQKADKFRDAVKKIELARSGVERLESDMKGGILKVSAEMMQALNSGLQMYGKMVEDARKMEEDAKEKEVLSNRVSALEDEKAAMQQELEELKIRVKKGN